MRVWRACAALCAGNLPDVAPGSPGSPKTSTASAARSINATRSAASVQRDRRRSQPGPRPVEDYFVRRAHPAATRQLGRGSVTACRTGGRAGYVADVTARAGHVEQENQLKQAPYASADHRGDPVEFQRLLLFNNAVRR